MKTHYDSIVIGAGPAGLMAAKTAAEKGLDVLLVDIKKNISIVMSFCLEQPPIAF